MRTTPCQSTHISLHLIENVFVIVGQSEVNGVIDGMMHGVIHWRRIAHRSLLPCILHLLLLLLLYLLEKTISELIPIFQSSHRFIFQLEVQSRLLSLQPSINYPLLFLFDFLVVWNNIFYVILFNLISSIVNFVVMLGERIMLRQTKSVKTVFLLENVFFLLLSSFLFAFGDLSFCYQLQCFSLELIVQFSCSDAFQGLHRLGLLQYFFILHYLLLFFLSFQVFLPIQLCLISFVQIFPDRLIVISFNPIKLSVGLWRFRLFWVFPNSTFLLFSSHVLSIMIATVRIFCTREPSVGEFSGHNC